MMKKPFAILLNVVLMLILTACGTLKEPPKLLVACDGESVEAWLGTYSWYINKSFGRASGVESDSMHPLECRSSMTPLEIGADGTRVAKLDFADEPDEVSIRCWSDECWGDCEADYEDFEADSFEFELLDGGHIYNVTARWNSSEKYSGTANYAFYAVVTEKAEPDVGDDGVDLLTYDDFPELTEPPALIVNCGVDSVEAALPNYSWTIDNGDGTGSALIACGAAPLQCREILEPLEITRGNTDFEPFSLTMDFGGLAVPDKITVRCWSEEYWDELDAPYETIAVSGLEFELMEGGYVYEISAEWNSKYSGSAGYVFYAVVR